MFFRDASRIPAGGCITIQSPTQLTHHTGNPGATTSTNRVFHLIGNQYIQATQTTGTVAVTAFCVPRAQINSLQSNFDHIIPFYHLAAIFVAIFLFFMGYKLILHPFWRKR